MYILSVTFKINVVNDNKLCKLHILKKLNFEKIENSLQKQLIFYNLSATQMEHVSISPDNTVI